MICPVCGREFVQDHHNRRKCEACKDKVVRTCKRCSARIVVDRRCKTRYCPTCVEAARRYVEEREKKKMERAEYIARKKWDKKECCANCLTYRHSTLSGFSPLIN